MSRRSSATSRALTLFAATTLGTVSCGGGGEEPVPVGYDFGLPAGFADPWVPPDNPMTTEKAELGKKLFFDSRLSANQTMSCSSCHERAKGFTDGKAKPTGSTGDLVPRNAMGLANVAWFPQLTWGNPTLTTLEQQALVPLFGETPIELGITGHEDEVLGRLRTDPDYVKAFAAAFPGEQNPIDFPFIAKALASYERTLIAVNSPYDQYTYGGKKDAMSASALRGMDLFFSEKMECYHCHSGVNFTTAYKSAGTKHATMDFQNTGLYNLGVDGAYPPGGEGLFEFTLQAKDKGKFRVPGLRNIELTAPYMHDGSMATLEEVMDHYAAGGRTIVDGPYAGDGSKNPNKSPLVKGFTLSSEEKADIIAFLKSLTDTNFVNGVE